jgi:CRISPR-associated protein Cas2
VARRRYLFSYDISDDKRRTRAFKVLDAWGDHAQYSVFFAELNDSELVRLKGKLEAIIHHDEDQVLILDLGPRAAPSTTRSTASGGRIIRRHGWWLYDQGPFERFRHQLFPGLARGL